MSKKKSPSKKRPLKPFNKYYYYEKSVQNPSGEVEFLAEKFQDLRGFKAKTLREDFCGTAAISCEWTKQGKEFKAYGIDLDPEPIQYGLENHYAKLSDDEKKRMHYVQGNVLNSKTPKVDICFAFNFSYFIFKKRSELLKYFKAVRKSLDDKGVFFLDLFGGPDSQTVMTDVVEHDDFDYFWDCQKFNPINNHCRFAIHFKRHGEKKRENVFIYEWRMWGMQELRDLLEEAGFSKTYGYWEGEDGEGSGDGIFTRTEEAENCDAWVTYIAAVK